MSAQSIHALVAEARNARRTLRNLINVRAQPATVHAAEQRLTRTLDELRRRAALDATPVVERSLASATLREFRAA